MMRYISQALHSFAAGANKLCLTKHLDGPELTKGLMKLVNKYEFGVMHPTAGEFMVMKEDITTIGAMKGICSAANSTGVKDVFSSTANPKGFDEFQELLYHFARALFISDGAEEIPKSQKGRDGYALLEKSIITVYLYYWASVLAMLLTLTILYRLNRPRDNDIGDIFSYVGRASMAFLTIVLISLYGNTIAWTDFIASCAMLPTLCGILAVVVGCDWLGRRIRVRKVKAYVSAREREEASQVRDKEEQERHDNTWIETVRTAHHSTASRRDGIFVPTRMSMYNWLMHTQYHPNGTSERH
jgi:hypothetical protein